jgi:uncharacterized protein YggT (Ycf19 family)
MFMKMKPAVFINNMVEWVTAAVTLFLGLRFVLRLFGANGTNEFVAWVYDSTSPLLEPFFGIFPTTQLERGLVVEFSTLFAIIIYALAGYLILTLVEKISESTVKKK